jgi:hypothetical protein
MALDQSALSELAAALKSGEVIDLVREAVRLVCQELIEAEATAQIGAGLYERSETRATERNGHRPRTWSTKAGDIELWLWTSIMRFSKANYRVHNAEYGVPKGILRRQGADAITDILGQCRWFCCSIGLGADQQ